MFFNALRKYLFKDTKYFFAYLFRFYQNNYNHHCSFYNDEEFISLINNGKSFIRIGDGEIGLLHFLGIHYQKYSNEIREDFLSIINTYSENSDYILLIPLFVNYTNKQLKALHKFKCWMPLKITYELIFNKKCQYMDSHIFYKDRKFEKIILPYIISKKVILVTNEENKIGILKTKFSQIIYKFVESPPNSAYEHRGEIEKNIKNIIFSSGYSKKDFVIIMCAGLAKTIIYEMSRDGYQIFDIGKGLEGYYKKESLEYLI